MTWQSLVFLDLETTGLSPTNNRITEIGLVAVDGDRVTDWTTLVNPRSPIGEGSRWSSADGTSPLKTAPFFGDIAPELIKLLQGRTVIAHNARFDYAFLKAEFQRLGMEFTAPVVCSAMLSRKLYAHLPAHDLDALMIEHGLDAEPRHRALPDAKLVWQLWQVIHAEQSPVIIKDAVEALLAGPVLPEHLDPTLIDKLPDRPGVYIMHGENDRVIHAGHAVNLRLHLLNYFRIDRSSAKALEIALAIRNITFRVTEGVLGARLLARMHQKRNVCDLYTWTLVPDDYPSLKLTCIPPETLTPSDETFGLYCSERRARNALRRLAIQHRLCHCLLGVVSKEGDPCPGCTDSGRGSPCGHKVQRLKYLIRATAALQDLRMDSWPFPNAVGVRERSDLHVFNNWRYLGTGRTEAEIGELVESPLPPFDEQTYQFLRTFLPRLSGRRVVQLASS